MSLPMPSAAGGGGPPAFANLTAAQQDKMDAPLIALTQQSGGDLRKLLYLFFSFLHRRTDFYCVPNERDLAEGVPVRMGFREGDAEKLMLAAFRQFPLRRMPRQRGAAAAAPSAAGEDPASKGAVGAKKNGGDAAAGAGKGAADAAKSDGKAGASGEGSAPASAPKGAEAEGAPSSEPPADSPPKAGSGNAGGAEDPLGDVRRTEEGKQIPVGNGGATDRYRWTQTIDEAAVVLPVPDGTRGRDLDVSIRPSRLSVRLRGGAGGGAGIPATTILEGGLTEKVRPDESTWSLEGGALLLTLDKVKKTWWEAVLEGDDRIDTSMVDSTRNISEYDEATQGAIRKILFDQRQERLGLPTSDEILGKKPPVPPLPDGVEYIDQGTLDKDEEDEGKEGETASSKS